MTYHRKTEDLCQTDWQDANLGEYFPETFRLGTCAKCGSEEFVARSRLADPGTYRCPCGWSRTILDGETIADAQRAHEAATVHQIEMVARR